MKYAANITIFDDEGNALYERDLTPDEIVAELLMAAKTPADTSPEGPLLGPELRVDPDAIEETPPAAPTGTGFVKHIPDRPKGQKLCKKCGEPGHMQKTCPKNHDTHAPAQHDTHTPPPGMNMEKPGRLTGIDFLKVKELQEKGRSGTEIAQQVRRSLHDVGIAMLSKTHSEYLDKA